MNSRLPKILIKGIAGGAFAGFITGAYVMLLTEDYVIQQEDFSHPAIFEEAQRRYASTLFWTFIIIFSAIGPWAAAATFGSWIRHAIYGLTVSIVLLVACTLVVALIKNEQPFNHFKVAKSTYIRISLRYLISATIVVGPMLGLLVGTRERCDSPALSDRRSAG